MSKNEKKIVLVTGGFDPLHSGHIELFNSAAKLGSKLLIGLNSDEWLVRKKGFSFLPLFERKIIIKNLKMVHNVLSWDDSDDTAIGAITKCLRKLKKDESLIFANGGDRTNINTPEINVLEKNSRIIFKFGVGGFLKKNSSSTILKEFFEKKNL